MKILFLTTNLSEGYGIVNYNKNLLKSLVDDRVRVLVIELRKRMLENYRFDRFREKVQDLLNKLS